MFKSLGSKIREIFRSGKIDEDFFESIEDTLIEGDLGGALTMEVSERLREICKKEKISDGDDINRALMDILSGYIKEDSLTLRGDKDMNLFLFLGVNGVGKTTTIGRLANYFKKKEGIKDIVLSAGDTFRAAAIDQLKIHGERTGCRVVAQKHGADPGAVIFDTIQSALAKNERLILADTAGRMHNRSNLIKELEKIDRIVTKEISPSNYKKLLVLDCTTGQNGLTQAEVFNSAVKIDGIVLTKYDSTAKGGIIPSICSKLGVPILFLGVGEGLDDIKPFNKDEYLKELLK